jgi:hypothetical protein
LFQLWLLMRQKLYHREHRHVPAEHNSMLGKLARFRRGHGELEAGGDCGNGGHGGGSGAEGRRPAAVLVGSVGLAVLASEYPDTFVRIREELPSYVRQGTRFLDLAMKIGSKIEELAEHRAAQAFEELGEY